MARWVAIVAGLMAVVMAFTPPSRRPLGMILVIALDIQLLLGFALYLVLSPNTKRSWQFRGGDARSRRAVLAVEHVSLMVFAVAMAHVGRVLPGGGVAAPGASVCSCASGCRPSR